MTIFEALEKAVEARAHEAIIAGICETQPDNVVLERAGKAFLASLAASGYAIVPSKMPASIKAAIWSIRVIEPDEARMYELILAAALKEQG